MVQLSLFMLLLASIALLFVSRKVNRVKSKKKIQQVSIFDPISDFLLTQKVMRLKRKHIRKGSTIDDDDLDAESEEEYDFGLYTHDEIVNTFTKLSSTQFALKSIDGATHQFRNTFKDNSSLLARFNKFIAKLEEVEDDNLHNKAILKEAAKISEYVNTVERGMQAIEICSAACSEDNRVVQLNEAGLNEIKRFCVKSNKFQCNISICRPINTELCSKKDNNDKFLPNELIVSIVNDVDNIGNILGIMNESDDVIPLMSNGLVKEDITIQPTILNMSINALEQITEFVFNGNNVTNNSNVLPPSIRIVGHSVGGSIGSYIAMLLDGSLNSTYPGLLKYKHLFGLYHKKVSCVAIGPSPCVSRTMIPRYITTIVNGDDIVPRTSKRSLQSMKERIFTALKNGAGKSGSLSWIMTTSGLVNDLTKMASKGLGQYTGGKHDLTNLSLPGRVFFVKSRKHKDGASIQRVLRGNWQEDMLWSLHEILISTKMVQHHTLESYFKTFCRC